MGPPKRIFHNMVASTESPPDSLPTNWRIARVLKAVGNNVYEVRLATNSADEDQTPHPISTLVELPRRFRNQIWLRRGSFVVYDREAFADRGNKLGGEIVNVVRDEKTWMRMPYWPEQFKVSHDDNQYDEDEESVVGKMPPSSESSDGNDGLDQVHGVGREHASDEEGWSDEEDGGVSLDIVYDNHPISHVSKLRPLNQILPKDCEGPIFW